ncbi:ATP-binding protein [Nocardia gamkensis]|uniref:ATP-binding protein n=1 Tax=Nocardia gamkensis TaxID=352869 RepID=UPI0036E3BBFD
MGPVGVGKAFLANVLGHIAVRRHHTVHTECADKLFKRLRGARLDGSYEDGMRKLHRVDLAHPRRVVLAAAGQGCSMPDGGRLGHT